MATKIIEENVVINEGADDDLLTVHQVARKLLVDDTTVRRWVKTGTIDAVALPHPGKRVAYRIKRGTLRVLLATPATQS